MASFRLMHRYTGTCIPGYRVASATPEEIQQANYKMKSNDCPYRYVIDLHPPSQAPITVQDEIESIP